MRGGAALVALVAVGAGGCLFDAVEGIPCRNDDECPTGYFCDQTGDTCAQSGGGEGVPRLAIPKVRDPSGALVLVPQVPPGATSTLGLQLENTGDGPADGIGLDFGYLACAAFEVHDDTVPAKLDPGKTAEVTVDVTTGAGGCAALTIIDWFAHYSGRSLRGTFDLDIAQ